MPTEITITIPEEKLREGLMKSIDSIFKSDYSNPFNELVKKALADEQGAIKKFVDECIAQAFTNQDFKDKISQVVITRLVDQALKPR